MVHGHRCERIFHQFLSLKIEVDIPCTERKDRFLILDVDARRIITMNFERVSTLAEDRSQYLLLILVGPSLFPF